MIYLYSGSVSDSLSGGEPKISAVPRGLIAGPVVLNIDTLLLGMSTIMSTQLLEKLLALKKSGKIILLVEQKLLMELTFSDSAFVSSQGCTDLKGPGWELLKNEKVRVAYLGIDTHAGERLLGSFRCGYGTYDILQG